MTIHVHAPGALTTVQDLGRPGWGSAGVAPSGAMDAFALRAANLLVGNDADAAGLEITITGPELVFMDAAVVALAGAPFDVALDGTPAPRGESIRVSSGGRLVIGRATIGARGYLAVRGGIDVPLILGSRSTHVAAGLGGKLGRALTTGDPLNVGRSQNDQPLRRLGTDALTPIAPEQIVRVVPGPQEDSFTQRGIDSFFTSPFRVSPRSDRTGVRLEGESIEHAGPADLDPEAVVTGAIQMPGDGQPIVLGPDRPATGGYVKIASVIAADLPLIAQARPGDTLRFVRATVEEARQAWRDRERAVAEGIEDIE